jgi:signal transduction histidine kinase
MEAGGKFKLMSELYSLRDVIISVVRVFQVRAEQKGVIIYTSIASDVPQNMYGDPVRFRQILLNLIGTINA